MSEAGFVLRSVARPFATPQNALLGARQTVATGPAISLLLDAPFACLVCTPLFLGFLCLANPRYMRLVAGCPFFWHDRIDCAQPCQPLPRRAQSLFGGKLCVLCMKITIKCKRQHDTPYQRMAFPAFPLFPVMPPNAFFLSGHASASVLLRNASQMHLSPVSQAVRRRPL